MNLTLELDSLGNIDDRMAYIQTVKNVNYYETNHFQQYSMINSICI